MELESLDIKENHANKIRFIHERKIPFALLLVLILVDLPLFVLSFVEIRFLHDSKLVISKSALCVNSTDFPLNDRRLSHFSLLLFTFPLSTSLHELVFSLFSCGHFESFVDQHLDVLSHWAFGNACMQFLTHPSQIAEFVAYYCVQVKLLVELPKFEKQNFVVVSFTLHSPKLLHRRCERLPFTRWNEKSWRIVVFMLQTSFFWILNIFLFHEKRQTFIPIRRQNNFPHIILMFLYSKLGNILLLKFFWR